MTFFKHYHVEIPTNLWEIKYFHENEDYEPERTTMCIKYPFCYSSAVS